MGRLRDYMSSPNSFKTIRWKFLWCTHLHNFIRAGQYGETRLVYVMWDCSWHATLYRCSKGCEDGAWKVHFDQLLTVNLTRYLLLRHTVMKVEFWGIPRLFPVLPCRIQSKLQPPRINEESLLQGALNLLKQCQTTFHASSKELAKVRLSKISAGYFEVELMCHAPTMNLLERSWTRRVL